MLGSVVLRAEPRRGGRGRPPAPPAAVPPQPPSLHPRWACSYPGPFFPAVRRLDPDALPPALQPALSPGHLGTTGFLLGKPAGRPACPPPGPSRRHSEVTWWGRPGPSAAAPRPRGHTMNIRNSKRLNPKLQFSREIYKAIQQGTNILRQNTK